MKKLLFYALAGIIVLSSCSHDDNPQPAPMDGGVFKLKSSEIVEFQQVYPVKDLKDIPVSEVSAYFGKRVELACPLELNFEKDSLTITKQADLTEKYKVKWQGSDLYLHRNHTDRWEYIGKKNANGQVLLNTGFYVLRGLNLQRSLVGIGQEYEYTNHTGMMAALASSWDSSMSVVWLKAEYVFE